MLHILIVDDSPPTREITAEQVRALGHRACQAGDGPAALGLLERERFDVVLMDLRMPGMDGVETARQIGARFQGRGPRVIALSGGDRRDCERCLAAGMEAFLTRPVSLAQLRAALDGRQAPAAPPPRPGALDSAYVDDLLAAIGPADLRLVAAPFIAETPALLARLSAARHQAEEAERLAHLLKGRALSLGASELAAHAAAIEGLAASRAPITLSRLAALDAAFAAAVEALRAYLARLPGA